MDPEAPKRNERREQEIGWWDNMDPWEMVRRYFLKKKL
jgi:hypothetical protein